MKKLYFSVLFLSTILGVSAQEVIWQKDIKSSTQDFLSQITTTIDQQYLITGSSIPSRASGTTPSRASFRFAIEKIITLEKEKAFN